MELKIELMTILGYSLLIFVVSMVYGCTKCGSRKIPWISDMLAIAVGLGAYVACFEVASGILEEQWNVWGTIASWILGYVATTVGICMSYKILYMNAPPAAEHH